MFEFLTTSIFGASSPVPTAGPQPQGSAGPGPAPFGVDGLAPEALPPAPPAPPPAASSKPAETAAPADPAAVDEQLELHKQITAVTHADGAWLWGADTGKLMQLVEGSPDTLAAMRTQSPELYRMMRAGVLGKLDDDERKKALELMPEASLQDLNRERHERGELTPELNEEVKKITPDRRKELEEAVAEIKASQGLLSNDLGKVRAQLAGKSPAEIEAMRRLWLDKFPGSVLNMDQFLEANFDDGDDAAEVAGLLSGDKVKATAGTVMNALYGMNDSKAAFDALEKVKDPAERARVAEEFKKGWLERLAADGETADLTALESDPALADPLKFMEKVTSQQADGVIFHDADADLARHLVNGEYGKAAAVKLDKAGGLLDDDEEAGYAALDGLEDPELRAQFDAELAARGTSLDEQLARFDGAEADVAMAKLQGDDRREQAARMRVAAQGAGTDKAALYKALEGKSRKEREAIIAEYDARYGKQSGREGAQDFDEMLVDELDEQDAGRIIFLDDAGKLDPELALRYAREGGGTDEKMGEDALERMPAEKRKALLADPEFMEDTFNLSKEELEQVQKDPSCLPMLLMKNRNALDLLDVQEVSGKEGFTWAQALLGDDYNQDGKVDELDTVLRAKDSYEFARGEGAGVFAKMADSAHASDMEVNLDLQHERILALQSKLVSGELTDADRERLGVLARYQDQDMKTVLEQREEVAQAAAGAAAATAGIVVTIATAGGGGAAAMAAWKIAMASAVASGTAGLGVKMGIQGDHMTNEAFATDLAMMVAQAASGGALASDKAGALFKALGAGMGKLATSPAGQKALSLLVQEAAKGGAQALGPAMVSALTNEEMWKGDGDPAKLFATMMLSQIASGAASNVTAAGLKGAIDSKHLANFLGGAGSASVSELINNHEAIAQAVREGRVTPEALQSIIAIAQSGADNMAEDALNDAGAPARKGAGLDAPPANDDARYHYGPTDDDRFAEGWLAADVEAEAYAYGDKVRAEAGLPEFVPIELSPEARPARAPESEGPRPYEDLFQERLEGEGQWSDDPDPHGHAAGAPDTMKYTPADQLATVKPPGYDEPVHAGAPTVRVPELADQPGTLRSPQLEVTPESRVVPVEVIAAPAIDPDAPSARRPEVAADVEANGPETRRSEGVTEADRLAAPEFPATRRSDELLAAVRAPETEAGRAAVEAAAQLFSLEKALAKRTETDWSGETYEEYVHDHLTGVEASIRQLASGNGSQAGQCTAESQQWQKMLAKEGVQATVMNYEPSPGPDGERKAIGHRWLVAGDVIIDPTFSQMFEPVAGDQNLAPLPSGRVWLEPFVGTYDQMKQRVAEAIAAGHMPDEVGNDPAEVIARNWGIKPPGEDGVPTFDKDVRPFGARDTGPASEPAPKAEAARPAQDAPSTLASVTGADARPYVDGMEKALASTPAGARALEQLQAAAGDAPVTITTERGAGTFRDDNRINLDPEATGDNWRKMAGELVEQMALDPEPKGATPEEREANQKRNAAEARAARIEHHLDEGFGPEADLPGFREYEAAHDAALAAGRSAEEARAAGVDAVQRVLDGAVQEGEAAPRVDAGAAADVDPETLRTGDAPRGRNPYGLLDGNDDLRKAANHPAVEARAEAKVGKMSPEDQGAYRALAAGAENEAQRVMIERAAAAGHPVEVLHKLAESMRGQAPEEILASYTGAGEWQKLSHSCVPTSFQIALAEMDPVYAKWLRDNPQIAAAQQARTLHEGGGTVAPRTDADAFEAGGIPQADMAADPRVLGFMNSVARTAAHADGNGMTFTSGKDTALYKQLEAVTGASYKVTGLKDAPWSAGVDSTFEGGAPHEAIQGALAQGMPVIFANNSHARAVLGMVEGPGGHPLYIMQDPANGVTSYVPAWSLDAVAAMPAMQMAIPEVAGPDGVEPATRRSGDGGAAGPVPPELAPGARKPNFIPRDVANAPVRHPAADGFAPGQASDAELQRQLVDKVEDVRAERAKDNPAAQISAKTRDPMLAGILDSTTGEVFTAANTSTMPEKMHPLIQERVAAHSDVFDAYKGLGPDERARVRSMQPDEMTRFLEERGIPASAGGMDTVEMLRLVDSRMRFKEQQLASQERWGGMNEEARAAAIAEAFKQARGEIGTHGELNALNAALLARQAQMGDVPLTVDDLASFLLHNTYAEPPRGGGPAGAMARCHHCESLTGGVRLTDPLAGADAHRDLHERM